MRSRAVRDPTQRGSRTALRRCSAKTFRVHLGGGSWGTHGGQTAVEAQFQPVSAGLPHLPAKRRTLAICAGQTQADQVKHGQSDVTSVAPPAGLEPAAKRLEGACSIH
jgi:hypothetical protein